MTTEEKTLLAILAAAALLVPVVLGTTLDWPVWSGLLLAVALLGVPGLMTRNIQKRVQRETFQNSYVTSPIQAEQQPQCRQTPVTDVALPSATDGYDFHFSATVYWRPAKGTPQQHANLGGLAADAILARTQVITATEQPNRVDVVAHRLAGVLGATQRDASGAVYAWADDVQLTLSEADQTRLRRLSAVPKDEDLWERERDHERRKRAYLGDDVLTSTGSTVVWWLAQRDNDVEDTVRLIGTLAQLSAAANDTEVPELFRHLTSVPALPGQLTFEFPDGDQQFSGAGLVTRRFGGLLDALNVGDDQRALFTYHGALLIEKVGKPDEAQEIRQCFDAPATDKQPAVIPEPDGELKGRPGPGEDPPPLQEEPWGSSTSSGESEQDGIQQVDDQSWSEPFSEPRD